MKNGIKVGYAYHKGHNAGLHRRELTQRFNDKQFQRDFEAGHARGLIDADIFEAIPAN